MSELLSSCPSRSFMFWTTFRVYSRFPEAYVSERPPDFSVPYSRFPGACWTEQHPEFVLLSSRVHLRVSCSPRAFRVTRIILSHRYALSRNETTCFCFRRWRSKRRASLRSFRHFRLLSCGKKRMAVNVATGRCGVVHEIKEMQQFVPLITRETAFCFNVCDSVFWIRHIWLGLLDPGWFCQISSPEQLGGCGTHVSSSDFCLWCSSLPQLRCLRKCTTVILSQRDGRSKELHLRATTFWSNTCLIMGVLWSAVQVSRVHAWVGISIRWFIPSTSITKSHKSSANKPSIRKPASNDMISDSVELWDTDVCFLRVQLIGSMFDFQKCTKLRLMWILSLQDLLQSLNLEIILICTVVLCFPPNNTGGNHLCNECGKFIVPIVCHMLESILWQIVPILLADHRMSGRPIPAKCKHSHTIWKQTSDNSPLFSNSSFFFGWSSKQGWETLYSCSVSLFANSQYRSTHFRACPSMS